MFGFYVFKHSIYFPCIENTAVDEMFSNSSLRSSALNIFIVNACEMCLVHIDPSINIYC